jgi:serine/threonine protein kinase
MFSLLTGRFPFEGENLLEVTANICTKKPKYKKTEKKTISKPVRKIIKKMLIKDYQKRISASISLKMIQNLEN